MSKLIPIDITGLNKIDNIMDKCHEIFKHSLASKENKVQLDGKEVLVPLRWVDKKADIFWHAASIEPKSGLDILPCNNDITSSICGKNCIAQEDAIVLNGKEREKCIYRAVRINWIRDIVKMYGNKDSRVKYWEKINTKKKNRIYLRYEEEEIDYLVVLEEKSDSKVQLITAYPVFFLSAKKDYEKDYENYRKRT